VDAPRHARVLRTAVVRGASLPCDKEAGRPRRLATPPEGNAASVAVCRAAASGGHAPRGECSEHRCMSGSRVGWPLRGVGLAS
jgi:hypothetical protein